MSNEDAIGYYSRVEEDGNTYTYRVYGLQARSSVISEASHELGLMLGERKDAAEAALATWRGSYAEDFVTDVNRVLGKMAGLKFSLHLAADRLSSFPEPPGLSIGFHDALLDGYRVDVETEPGTAAADPAKLRDYVTIASAQDDRLETLAGTVSFDGVTAESYWIYPTESDNPPDELFDGRFTHFEIGTEPVSDLYSLIPLDSPDTPGSPLNVDPLKALSGDLNVFTSNVADEFDMADEAAGGGGRPGGPPGGVEVPGVPPPGPAVPPPPESPTQLPEVAAGMALAVIAREFTLVDRPEAGDPATFGLLTREELAEAAEDGELPPNLRAAALRVAEDPALFAAVAVVHQPLVADPEMHLEHVSLDDITTFLGSAEALVVLRDNVGVVDLPEAGGQPDGIVTPAELAVAANDVSVTPEVRDAARFLLDNPVITQRLAAYDALYPADGGPVDPQSLLLSPVLDPETGEPVVDSETGRMLFDPAPFSVENLERMASDHEQLLELVDEAEPTQPTSGPDTGRVVYART